MVPTDHMNVDTKHCSSHSDFVRLLVNGKRDMNTEQGGGEERKEGSILLLFACACSVASAVSGSYRAHGLEPIRLLCPWSFPGKNTGVDCHFLLQGIFLTQGLNLCHLWPLSGSQYIMPLQKIQKEQ